MELPERVGRYEVKALLGAGGMGRVYLAQDPKLNRAVAVKVLAPAFGSSEAARTRFLREIRAAQTVSHPNAVRLLDGGVAEDGSLYFVMEHVLGEDLEQRLERETSLAPAEAVRVCIDVLGALGAMHEHGMVHRDLKPGNVMMDATGRVILMDFGLVRFAELTAVTSEGEVLGTLRFLPPEVLMGETSTPRSDIYQVGLLLSLLVTGRLPWDGLERYEAMVAAIRGDRGELVAGAGMSSALGAFVRRACLPDPAERFESAAAAAAALAAAAAPASRPARRPRQSTLKAAAVPAPRPALARAGGRRRLPLLVFVVVALGAVGAWLHRSFVGGAPVQVALTGAEATPEGVDGVRLRFGTDRPVTATVELAGPGGRRSLEVTTVPSVTHEVLVGALAPGDEYPDVEAVLTADGTTHRRRLPPVTGCLGLMRRFETEVADADPRALAERMDALLVAGDAPAFAAEVAALRRSRVARALEEVRPLAAAVFGSQAVPFDAKHGFYRRLEELAAIDAVAHEYRAAPPLAVAGCTEPWIRSVPRYEPPEGTVLWDGFARPLVLRLLDARSSDPRMLDTMAVTWYYHGTPKVGELRFQGHADPSELGRVGAVQLSVWPLWSNPIDEVRVAVNGREVSFHTDATVGRGRDLTQEQVGAVLRNRKPGPSSFPLVVTLPTGYVVAGANDFRLTYRTACPVEQMRYYMILDVRWNLPER